MKYRKPSVHRPDCCTIQSTKTSMAAAIGTYWAHQHQVTAEQAALLQALADITAVTVQNIEHKQNLEHIVSQRTEELAASRDELTQLAYVVSHELQEPLRSMSSDLRLLSIRYRNELGADAQRFIDSALQNSTSIEGMLDALWLYARIDKTKTVRHDIDTGELLTKILSKSAAPIEAAQINITGDTNLPRIRANADQIEYLFQEIIANAVKFSDAEELKLTISAQKNGNFYVFTFSDNGVGFDMVEARNVFTMFKQLNQSTAGTGMGLSICKRIVESHGGEIWLQSQIGQGTTVYFSLPI